MSNLMDGLQEELVRNRELLTVYQGIPSGEFSAVMIKTKIDAAEKAITQGDTAQMLICYSKLRGSE